MKKKLRLALTSAFALASTAGVTAALAACSGATATAETVPETPGGIQKLAFNVEGVPTENAKVGVSFPNALNNDYWTVIGCSFIRNGESINQTFEQYKEMDIKYLIDNEKEADDKGVFYNAPGIVELRKFAISLDKDEQQPMFNFEPGYWSYFWYLDAKDTPKDSKAFQFDLTAYSNLVPSVRGTATVTVSVS